MTKQPSQAKTLVAPVAIGFLTAMRGCACRQTLVRACLRVFWTAETEQLQQLEAALQERTTLLLKRIVPPWLLTRLLIALL